MTSVLPIDEKEKGVSYPVQTCFETEGRRQKKHTIRGPLDASGAEAGRAVLVDLEPDGALAVEGSSRLAGGGLGHVEVERAGVTDAGHEGEVGAGLDVKDLGGGNTGVALVAGHGLRVDIGDGAVGVVVLGDADVLPLARDNSIVLGLVEGVVSLGSGRGQEGNRGSAELHGDG